MGGRSFQPKRWVKVLFGAIFLFSLLISVYTLSNTTNSFDLSQLNLSEYADYPTLSIPDIDLLSPVETIELSGRQLIAPDHIAGSFSQNLNKTLLIGHSSTVFQSLDQTQIGAKLIYNGISYRISEIETLAKKDVNMMSLLKSEPEDTVVIMTCAGKTLPNQDATHRLIVTAKPDSELATNTGVI